MIDLSRLTIDISANVVSLALPGVLWAFFFLVAFEHSPFAESIGFGRRAFWLLLPGSLLASVTLLPIAPIANDWLAISFAGAVFPLFVAGLAFDRFASPAGRSLSLFILPLAALTTVLLVLVLPPGTPLVERTASLLRTSFPIAQDVVVSLATTLGALVVVGFGIRRGGLAVPLAFLFALTSGVLVVTFVASIALPGVGIEEGFPIYLVPPIGVGFFAVLGASRVFRDREAFALPVAFVASTLGVLVGADVLRQPPLYAGGPPGLYTIGGAGVVDLVYLSGLLALAAAYAAHRLLGRGFTPVGPGSSSPVPTPFGRLVLAFRAGVDGRVGESLAGATAASRDAALQAGRLLGVALPPSDRPWTGLPVPGWIVADYANLAAAARIGTVDGREGFRGWLTARWLVQVARDLGGRRFGSIRTRVAAFAIDLLVVGLPAVAVWTWLVLTLPGNLDAVLGNVGFNAAAFGFVALAFLYFVLAETMTGTTLGKAVVGLVVRDRSLGRPSALSFLVRNTPLLPPLTIVGIGLPVAIALLLKVGKATSVSLAGVVLPGGLFAFAAALGFVVGGVGLLGSLGILVIAITSERQRLGDVLAGTWVVRASTPTTPAAPPTAGRSS